MKTKKQIIKALYEELKVLDCISNKVKEINSDLNDLWLEFNDSIRELELEIAKE